MDEEKIELATLSGQLEKKNTELLSLQDDYEELEYDYYTLSYDLEYANDNWLSISKNILDFRKDLYSYCVLNESFARIFSTSEVNKIASKVEELVGNEEDLWDAMYYIHQYVRDDVNYVYDSSVPIIDTYNYYGESTEPYLADFHVSYVENLYQPLSFTVEYVQGDCDDQAMLEYAMIKYFERNILEEEYRLYLVYMAWDDSAHLTVFLPVQDDNICILDPAGQYQTGSRYLIESKSVRSELLNYQDYWYDDFGYIRELSFWEVDIDTGQYNEDFSGTLEEAIEFFETTS